jgi:hypothetical protein
MAYNPNARRTQGLVQVSKALRDISPKEEMAFFKDNSLIDAKITGIKINPIIFIF